MSTAPFTVAAIAISTNLLVGCADIASPQSDGSGGQTSSAPLGDGGQCRSFALLGPVVSEVLVYTLERTAPREGRGAAILTFAHTGTHEEPTLVTGCQLHIGQPYGSSLTGVTAAAIVENRRFPAYPFGQSNVIYYADVSFMEGNGTGLMATVELGGSCYQPWRVSVVTPARPQVMELALPTVGISRIYSPNEPLTIRWQPQPTGDVGIWLMGVRRANGVREPASLRCIRPFADGQFTITPELWQLFDEYGATELEIGGIREQRQDAARVTAYSASVRHPLQLR